MKALLLGEEEFNKLNQLRNYADKNKIEIDEMLDILNGDEPPVGDREEYKCFIPIGFKIVFCIEHQKKGLARHLSMTIAPPIFVQQIMSHLGFEKNLKEVFVYFENNDSVVNVVEYI